jgi:uncharacterized coiled-coil protein SlyX
MYAMQAKRTQIPRVAFLVTGFAVGAMARLMAPRSSPETALLKRSLADVEARLLQHESACQQKSELIEARLDDHETRLNDAPSTGQIVAAMEQLLGRTMQSLNQRLAAQAEAVDLLKTTVSQTDALLERVIGSLDSLREEPAGPTPAPRPHE